MDSFPTSRRASGAQGDVLGLAARRLAWADRRQAVLAQNIANTDTPRYRPRDTASFERELSQRMASQGLPRSSPLHLSPSGRSGAARQDPRAPEVAPDGNAVSLDREAMRVAETDTAHALAMAVHRSFMGMFRLTLGRQG